MVTWLTLKKKTSTIETLKKVNRKISGPTFVIINQESIQGERKDIPFPACYDENEHKRIHLTMQTKENVITTNKPT